MAGVKRSFELSEDLADRLKLTAELADRSQTYVVREALDVCLPSLASLNTLLEEGEELVWPPAPAEAEPEPQAPKRSVTNPATGFLRDPEF